MESLQCKSWDSFWIIADHTNKIVITQYRTYQGNVKKALFRSEREAEEVIKKHFDNAGGLEAIEYNYKLLFCPDINI
jgi:hypothetical protein